MTIKDVLKKKLEGKCYICKTRDTYKDNKKCEVCIRHQYQDRKDHLIAMFSNTQSDRIKEELKNDLDELRVNEWEFFNSDGESYETECYVNTKNDLENQAESLEDKLQDITKRITKQGYTRELYNEYRTIQDKLYTTKEKLKHLNDTGRTHGINESDYKIEN